MQYVDLIYVHSVEWLLLPSNMLLPHISAVFIGFFLFIFFFFFVDETFKVYSQPSSSTSHIVAVTTV